MPRSFQCVYLYQIWYRGLSRGPSQINVITFPLLFPLNLSLRKRTFYINYVHQYFRRSPYRQHQRSLCNNYKVINNVWRILLFNAVTEESKKQVRLSRYFRLYVSLNSLIKLISLSSCSRLFYLKVVIYCISSCQLPPANKSQQYKLRLRTHSFILTCKSSYYNNNCKFIICFVECFVDRHLSELLYTCRMLCRHAN